MATLTSIYDIETAVISGSRSILTANGITAVPVQREGDDVVSPRVELQVVGVTPTRYLIQNRSGSWMIGKFTGQLNAVIVTERASNTSYHSDYVAKVLYLLSDHNNYNSGSGMPVHYMGNITFGNVVSNTTDPQMNLDMTAVSFPFDIWVKAGMYP